MRITGMTIVTTRIPAHRREALDSQTAAVSLAVDRSPPRRGAWLGCSLALLLAAGCAESTVVPPPRHAELSCPLCRVSALALVTPLPPEPMTPLEPEPTTCPTVPPAAPLPPHASVIQDGACWASQPIIDSFRVPLASDVRGALACLEAYDRGPRDFPFAAMLASAVAELRSAYPGVDATTNTRGVTLSLGERRLKLGVPTTLKTLTVALLRIAELAREVVSDADAERLGSPEHLLLAGSLRPVAWRPMLVPRSDQPRLPDADEGYANVPPSTATQLGDDIFYVRVGHIQEGMAMSLRRQMTGGLGLRGVILDLRGSPGGGLSASVALADLFARRGCLGILRSGERVEPQDATREPGDVDAPVVVLIDHRTGAGAEWVAAALRARDRAALVGEPTVGSGVVHAARLLVSGAQLLIPTGELFTPDGAPLADHPVRPDLPVPVSVGGTMLDPAITFAKQLLLHAKGSDRAAILKAPRHP